MLDKILGAMGLGGPAPAEAMIGPSGEQIYGDPANQKVIPRTRPEPDEATREQVKEWIEKVKKRKKYLDENEFKTMREDQDFVDGYQVVDADGKSNPQRADQANAYVVNLAQRHVKERTASLYAKNPKAVAKRREKIDSQIWDGKADSAVQAQERMAMGAQQNMKPMPEDQALMMEIASVLDRRKMIDNVGKSMVLCFNYYLDEQIPPFKTSAKQMVRRVETCGVGYVKLGFKRLMEKNNEVEGRLNDHQQRLDYIEAMAADLADGEIQDTDAEAAALRESIQALQQELIVIAYEGLTFDWPDADKIIPGPGCKHILTFTSAPWIAEWHEVPVSEIKERFGVDLQKGDYIQHKSIDPLMGGDEDKCIWIEVYDLKAGVVRHLVDGYCDYLEEPKANPVFFEQGHPYFPCTFNNVESRKSAYPQSDVRLIRPQCLEYNRAREGVRKHRIANRPAYVGRKGLLKKDDLLKFGSYEDHELIELDVSPQEDLAKVFVAKPTIPVDPAIYDTEYVFTDLQRSVGAQAANFGGTSGASATEVSVAAESKGETVDCDKDGLDDWLTAVARAAGQIMLAELSPETVKKIAGEGAVWPDIDRQTIADEVFLEVKAGSSGAPNKAKELADIERVAPTLLQIPGIQPAWLADQIVSRMDVGVDTNEAIVEGLPSIQAINAMAKSAAQPPAAPPGAEGDDPSAQGAQGANNEPQPPGPEAGQPMYPATEVPAPGMLQ